MLIARVCLISLKEAGRTLALSSHTQPSGLSLSALRTTAGHGSGSGSGSGRDSDQRRLKKPKSTGCQDSNSERVRRRQSRDSKLSTLSYSGGFKGSINY